MTINTGRTVFSQIMDYLSLHEFRKFVKRHQGNYKVKSFSFILLNFFPCTSILFLVDSFLFWSIFHVLVMRKLSSMFSIIVTNLFMGRGKASIIAAEKKFLYFPS
ncbi:MAG: DUF4372 domain-containing protein [Candidatus Aminicenantales bacterium]